MLFDMVNQMFLKQIALAALADGVVGLPTEVSFGMSSFLRRIRTSELLVESTMLQTVPFYPKRYIGVFLVFLTALGMRTRVEADTNAWQTVKELSTREAFQAAAADGEFVYAIASRQVAKYDRETGERIALSSGEAEHLNSGVLWRGKLLCAHSNYPQTPEHSEIKALNPRTMKLSTFQDFGNYGGSLVWVVWHDDHWWCNFARYGDKNVETFLVRFNEGWIETGRWSYPQSVIDHLGNYSLSGGLWFRDELLVTGHDKQELYRLRLPASGTVLEFIGRENVPFTGQGIAVDFATGGLVGISRAERKVIFVKRQRAEPERNVPAPPEGFVLECDIKYRDGHDRWLLNVIRPNVAAKHLVPAILLIHGGGWSNGDHYRFTTMGYRLAAEGYVVVLPTYRMLQDAPFPACLHDVKTAIRWVRANAEKYNIDPEHIGAYGNSAGGTLALTAAVTNGNEELDGDGPYRNFASDLQAVVCSGAVGNMLHEKHSRRAAWVYRNLAGAQDQNRGAEMIEATMRAASPSAYVHKDAPPILLIHGAQDEVVFIQSTDEFHTSMKDAGAEIEYLRYEDAGHGVMGQKGRETMPAMSKFFRQHLKMPVPPVD